MNVLRFFRLEVRRQNYIGVLPLTVLAAVMLATIMTVVGIQSIDTEPSRAIDPVGITVKGPPVLADDVRIQREARGALSGWMIIALIAFCFGAAVTAGERSAGTLRRSLLLHPNRVTYALGKTFGAAAIWMPAGFAIGLANWLLGQALLSRMGIERTSSVLSEMVIVGAGAVTVGAFGVLGASAGLVVRSAYALIAVGVVFLMVGETVIGSRFGRVGDVLPGHLLERISRGGTSLWNMPDLSAPAAVLILVGWAVLSTAICTLAFKGVDVA